MNQLSSAVKDLMTEGVEIIDLTRIFSETHATVSSESYCHLNERGKDILANAVLATVARQYDYTVSR